MKRGEVWTASGGGGYAGKPRPVVIVQDDRFDATESVTVCGLTTHAVDAPIIRIPIEPDDANHLRDPSFLMVDKITTVPKSRLRARIGRLSDEDVIRFNRSALVFLGLAAPVRSASR